MTFIVTVDQIDETVNIYGQDGLMAMLTDVPKEIGHMRSMPLQGGKKAVYVYRNHRNEICARISNYGLSLSSQIKKRWRY